MFIVGKEEEESNQVSIRKHKVGDLGKMEFIDARDKLLEEIFDDE